MRLGKKVIGCISILGLTVSLAACGEPNTSNTGENKDTTLSDVLNGKEKRKVAMTERKGNTGEPEVRWAGYIGDGKVQIHPYTNMEGRFNWDEIEDVDDSEFKDILKKYDKDYQKLGSNKKLNIKPEKAKITILTDDNKTAALTGLDFKAKGNKEDKFDQLDRGFGQTVEKHNDNWLEMKTDDENETVIHVESENDEKNLVNEDIKKVKDKYDNINVIERD